MFRQRTITALIGVMLIAQTGCSVDINGTASNVITSIITFAFSNVAAGVVNSAIPLPG